MDNAKIYGLCLERLKFQIGNAKKKISREVSLRGGHILLESYNTDDPEDIIDIMELYDIEARTFEAVKEKLEELAYTVSILSRETLTFGITDEGHFGLYLAVDINSFKDIQIEEAVSA